MAKARIAILVISLVALLGGLALQGYAFVRTRTGQSPPVVGVVPEGEAGPLGLQGRMAVVLYDPDGQVVARHEARNIITDIGKAAFLAEAFGPFWTPASIPGDNLSLTVLEVGDCGADGVCNPPTASDTALERAVRFVSRLYTPAVDVASTSVTMVFRIGTTTADEVYREAGLRDANRTLLFNRVTFPPVHKPAGSSVEFFLTFILP
ncbi:MAG: phage tail protein [Dehalococcoidia bacterium]|nr:phage tail protein [Dehalococcoidia bacterium]MDW8120359.1 hypothetical protein [Chloroflexota bacterium]